MIIKMKETFICGYVLSNEWYTHSHSMRTDDINVEYQEVSTDIPQFFSDKSQ